MTHEHHHGCGCGCGHEHHHHEHHTVTPEAAAVCKTLNDNGVAKLEELGMSVYEPTEDELAAWHDAMRDPCVEYVKGQLGDEIVDELLAAIEAA